MGAGYSTSQDQTPSRALHVLRVTPASPASQANIEPFFDFVVGFEGDAFNSGKSIDASELEKIVESHEDRVLNLFVWNSKNRDTRVVAIVPSRAWSVPKSDIPDPKEPGPESKPSLLGLSMRMCEPEYSLDNVWHVLDVLEGSPAEDAGLVPYGDWIIGWSGGVLSAENDFYDVVESHTDKPLRVYVYSHDFDTIREVVLVPNRQWGGEGLLGCVFGFGLLHRIPSQPADREPGSTPPELREDDGDLEEQTLFVPAQVPIPQPVSPDEYHLAFRQSHAHFQEEEWGDVHDGEEVHDHEHHDHGHEHDHGHDHSHEHGHGPEHHSHEHGHGSEHHDHEHGHESEHHDREYDHGHEHSQTPQPQPVSPTPTRTLPIRTASFHQPSNPDRSSTPTPSGRPFGALVNGLGNMNIGRFGPGVHSSPPHMERNVSFGSAMSGTAALGIIGGRGAQDSATYGDEEQSNDFDDGVTSAETTDDDETASQGSLTSID